MMRKREARRAWHRQATASAPRACMLGGMSRRGRAWFPLLTMLLVLLACKQGAPDGAAGSECSQDSDCKNGLLCEARVCVPEETARKARAAERAAEQPTSVPATSPSATGPVAEQDEKVVSGFQGSGMKSKTPTVKEWDSVGEITVRHSSPLGCETKMVREWLRVSCRTGDGSNQIQDVKVLDSRGVKSYEIFTYQRQGVASIVLPIRRPIEATVRFRWTQWGPRVLSIRYPHGAPAPQIYFDRSAPK
jgi:hypothetical protein